MTDCSRLLKCPFFTDQIANMPAVSGYLKKQFCQGNFAQCARYQVAEAVGAVYVPKDMYPNEQQRANEVIAKAAYYKPK